VILGENLGTVEYKGELWADEWLEVRSGTTLIANAIMCKDFRVQSLYLRGQRIAWNESAPLGVVVVKNLTY
jgi:hypothetical protein